ncbi:hypothetical protein FSARC_4578 [Fusarium sarcochroum]|uniref:RBR-type E3 ubiquitin transferase n=1 Tax=Fusarium sarcochroum TaxID=1208366 RepID=A0A8H4XBC6_9HYPO|nr:hypothetical protein FSARC_4578 [Fusarium sarcochroum]
MELLGIDDASLMLAIQLQQEDLELWDKSRKGKYKEGEIPDSDLAFEAYRQELESFETLVSDQALSLSIARAVETDQNILSVLAATDEQSSRDRDYALRLSDDPNARATPQSEPANDKSKSFCEDDIFEQIRALYVPPPNQAYNDDTDTFDFISHAESSQWAATRPMHECTGCLDQFPPLALTTCPCSHNYCRQCLVKLFLASFKDESLFPPRCCQEAIPVEGNSRFLSPELVGQYRAKKMEFETTNRVYCSRPSCSTFVSPLFVEDEVAHCPRCGHKTCSVCKGDSHSGICPSDTGSQQVLRMAEENHWQRCYSCRRVVEWEHGCHHMSKTPFPPQNRRSFLVTVSSPVTTSLSMWCAVLLYLRQEMENMFLRAVDRRPTYCESQQHRRQGRTRTAT